VKSTLAPLYGPTCPMRFTYASLSSLWRPKTLQAAGILCVEPDSYGHPIIFSSACHTCAHCDSKRLAEGEIKPWSKNIQET
jgi:hypothetical protein